MIKLDEIVPFMEIQWNAEFTSAKNSGKSYTLLENHLFLLIVFRFSLIFVTKSHKILFLDGREDKIKLNIFKFLRKSAESQGL